MNCRAYFTVEASLLTPLIFLLIIWVLYMGMFQYDRCLLIQDAYILAMTESRNYYLSNEQIYQNIKNAEAEWDWNKYAAFQKNSFQAEAGKGRVRVSVESSVRMPFRFPFLRNETWNIHITKQSKIVNPVFIIRNYKKFEDTANTNRKEEDDGKGNY